MQNVVYLKGLNADNAKSGYAVIFLFIYIYGECAGFLRQLLARNFREATNLASQGLYEEPAGLNTQT